MEYTTDFTDQDLLNSDGCQVEYFFLGTRGIGVLTVENGSVYLCQNDYDGLPCQDKKEFYHSYMLDLNDPSKRNYYKEIIQKIYKPKSLVGRYLKALVDNAQGSKIIKNNFYKIEFENPELVEFYTEFLPEITLRLDKENEGVFFELMPEGFEPNQNSTVFNVELVKGEYYVVAVFNQRWIFKFDIVDVDNHLYCDSAICLTGNQFYIGGNLLKTNDIKSISKANFSERLWLDKCIATGKFIPKEEALKEKEFVLPEKWCIKISKENIGICQKHNVLNKYYNYDYTIGAYYGNKMGGDYKIPENTTEITFEQFNKYVLKEEEGQITHSIDKPIHEFEKLQSYIKDETMKTSGISPSYLGYISGVDLCPPTNSLGFSLFNHQLEDKFINKKSVLEFQEPVIIKSIKNKPKLIIINN